jgi:NTP pyrophosphatase (non-canonical NTP hydrolase)
MKDEMTALKQFQDKYNVSKEQRMYSTASILMRGWAQTLIGLSKEMEQYVDKEDKRFLRIHLLTEELGELCEAMANGNEVPALDGITDLLYVLIGTAVTFDWPLPDSFWEVHASNMTKTRKSDDPGRIRDKGPDFQPPDLKGVLYSWRQQQR